MGRGPVCGQLCLTDDARLHRSCGTEAGPRKWRSSSQLRGPVAPHSIFSQFHSMSSGSHVLETVLRNSNVRQATWVIFN